MGRGGGGGGGGGWKATQTNHVLHPSGAGRLHRLTVCYRAGRLHRLTVCYRAGRLHRLTVCYTDGGGGWKATQTNHVLHPSGAGKEFPLAITLPSGVTHPPANTITNHQWESLDSLDLRNGVWLCTHQAKIARVSIAA